MRIISPTKLQKKKLKEMIHKLYPSYAFVYISDNGVISMSKSFWHMLLFIVEKVHVSEMCTVYIPEKLDRLYCKVFEDDDTPVYHRVYNRYSHIVLDLLHYRNKSVIDYLYDEFITIKYKIRKNSYVIHNVLPEITYTLAEILSNPIKKDGIVLSRLSKVYAKQALKRWQDSLYVFKHPKLLSEYLDLWFKREVKEKLQQVYQLKIRLAI